MIQKQWELQRFCVRARTWSCRHVGCARWTRTAECVYLSGPAPRGWCFPLQTFCGATAPPPWRLSPSQKQLWQFPSAFCSSDCTRSRPPRCPRISCTCRWEIPPWCCRSVWRMSPPLEARGQCNTHRSAGGKRGVNVEYFRVNVAPRGLSYDSWDKNNSATDITTNMQIHTVLLRAPQRVILVFPSPQSNSDNHASTPHPKDEWRGCVCNFWQTPLFYGVKSMHHTVFPGNTLNLGTGRSVSLYLVQRRPILGSRTMSTGGIPGFCRRENIIQLSIPQLHTWGTCCKALI